MVKIVHMADTHLGYREGKGTISKWAIENYSKPYEQELYDTFLDVMENVSKLKDLDFLIHCGDMFHQPHLYNSYSPPEPARRVLKNALDLFFKNTNNEIPFIYIEGNHGVFRGYDYTPFESHISKKNYPSLYYFKEKDLIEAIKNNKPLKLEFNEKKVRFYLFPYFEFKAHETYKTAYDRWTQQQKPLEKDGYINVAIAHGSEGDGTLHKILRVDDYGYDYVALGHEHILKQEAKNRYYAGCLLPMNFKERYETQGYLIVDIDKASKDLKIEKIFTDKMLKRPFEIVQLNISPQESSFDLINKVNRELEKHISQSGFDPRTSARLKFNFQGELTYERNWQINDIMARIRRDCFSQTDRYNILQLIWNILDISKSLEDDISPGIIEDYILEEPDREFKEFIKEKLSDEKTEYDISKLTQFGMKAIKDALKIMEREKEV